MRAIKLNNNKIKIKEPFKGLFTQGMVCHETYKDKNGNWMSPEDIKKIDKSEIIVGPPEAMSKSKKNVIDPEGMIDIYGADAIRWFMLSDSPPDRDIQWSNEGVSSAHKFIQKIWQINQKILKRKDVEKSLKDEKIFSAKVNKYLFKITNLIEKFHLNVAVANFYEIFRLINESIETKISNKCLKDSQINIMKIIMPFIPHMASECLIELEGKDFYLHSNGQKLTNPF